MYKAGYWDYGKLELNRRLAASEVAIIISMLKVPATTPVLLALTTLLNDDTTGEFGFEDQNRVMRDGMTKPLKVLAHDFLVSQMKVDWGYDPGSWSRELYTVETGVKVVN
jgi:hypothetical protein